MKKILLFLITLLPVIAFAQPCADEDTVRSNSVSQITYNSARINGSISHFSGSYVTIILKYVRVGHTDTASSSNVSPLRNLTGLASNTVYVYYYETVCVSGVNNQHVAYYFTTAANTIAYVDERPTRFHYLYADTLLQIGATDTSLARAPTHPSIVYKNSDNTYYAYHLDCSCWQPLAIDSAGIIALLNDKVDSVTVSGDSLFYWKLGVSYGYIVPTAVASASNGNTAVLNDIKWGGTLSEETTIDGAYNVIFNHQNTGFGTLSPTYKVDVTGGVIADTVNLRAQTVFAYPTSMISFGNSITLGPPFCTADSVYPARIRDYYGISLSNQAVSGSGVWSATGLAYSLINPGHSYLETYMSGFNDARRGDVLTNRKTLNKILNSFKADWLNHFAATSVAANSGSGSIVKSGTWANYAANTVGGKYANGAFTVTSGDYIEYSFNGTSVGVGLIAFDSTNQAGATFWVYIDGAFVEVLTENQQTDGISDGVNNNQRSAMALVYSGLSTGSHTIKLVSKQSTNVFAVDYFATLASTGTYPPLVWFTPPKMNATGYATAPANASDAGMDLIATKLDSLLTALPIGFPAYLVETNNYYNVATGLGADNIHPNDLGQRQFFTGYLATVPAFPNFRDNTIIANTRPFWIEGGVPHQFAFSDEIPNVSSSQFIQNGTTSTQVGAFKISGESWIENRLNLGSASISGDALKLKVGSGRNITFGVSTNNTISSINDAGTDGQALNIVGSGLNYYNRASSSNTLAFSVASNGDVTSAGYLQSGGAVHVRGSVVAYPGAGLHLQYNGGANYIDGYDGASWINTNIRGGDLNFTSSGTATMSLKSGSVGIGVATADASAIVDITSTTKGVLVPRMTTTQKNAISSPAEGLMVYDLTLHKLYVYDGTTWQAAW